MRAKTPAAEVAAAAAPAAHVAAAAPKPAAKAGKAAPASADVDWNRYRKRMHSKAYHTAQKLAKKVGCSDEIAKARARAARTAECVRLMELKDFTKDISTHLSLSVLVGHVL